MPKVQWRVEALITGGEHEVGRHLDAMLGKQPMSNPKPIAATEAPPPFPSRAMRNAPQKDRKA